MKPGSTRVTKKKKKLSMSHFSHYTLIKKSLDQVLLQIKDDPSLRWLEKLKTPLKQRSRNTYCRFHKDNGHNIEECFDMKEHIEDMIH